MYKASETRIENCIFDKDTDDVTGGAVDFDGVGNIWVRTCEFVDCDPNRGGGMYSGVTGTLHTELWNCSFVTYNAEDAEWGGGAIIALYETVNISKCLLDSCSAAGYGEGRSFKYAYDRFSL